MLYDADIRDSLCLFLEEKYGKVRFFDELRIGNSRADMLMVTEHDLIGIEIKSDADSYSNGVNSRYSANPPVIPTSRKGS